MESAMRREFRRSIPAFAVMAATLLMSAPALADEARTVCRGAFEDLDGQATVNTKALNGAPVSTIATFVPLFHNTTAGLSPASVPDVVKADGITPNIGAYPAAMFYYQYLTAPDGRHTLPVYRLRLEVPAYSEGSNGSVFFKVRIGTWDGGKAVERRDISGIVGVPDVPIYGVDFEIRPFDTRQADADGPALAAVLSQVDQAEIEIHEGSADGPLRIKGTINLAAHKDRFMAVAGALKAAAENLRAGTCEPDT